RPAMMELMYFYQKVYEDAVRSMDIIIANSVNVQKRIKQYLSADSVVVYPPCDTAGFRWLGQGDYYLSTARPDLLKRVDVIVRAFLKMPDKKLVVVSGGSELERIRNMAKNAQNIKILGWVDESRLVQLTGKCIATIYIPEDEDFGMSPVESMAAGKPVIGVAEGGLLETVKDGETGILIKAFPSYEDVIQAVIQMTPESAKTMRMDCEKRALRFRTQVFVEKIDSIVAKLGPGPAKERR
ncbi:MAG: glycosyltransferase, partial [Deltaproteobacteria bacterium]|nr:glycosyltransferase [Deltaproteobacteria bacterium]